MQTPAYSKFLLLTVLTISLSTLRSVAQIEVNGGICESKLKSDRKNYDSKYKPPDWWVEAWKWAKGISDFFYGGNRQNAITPEYGDADPAVAPPAEKKFYLSYGVGIGIGTRGGKYEFADETEKATIWYLQVPAIMVRFNYKLNNGAELFAATGPYYAIALGGRYKSGDTKESLKFGNGTDDDYRRGDWGLKFRLGYKFKQQPIAVGFKTDWGLRNIVPGGDFTSIKNRTLGLMVSYEL